MSLKTIFQEGMKEKKRKKSLGKVNSEFKEKEKSFAAQLISLGQKAWEARIDIAAYPELKSALGDTQKVLDELKIQAEQLLDQKRAAESEKKRESERLGAAIKEAEEKKRSTDNRLAEKKSTLEGGQKETLRATDRLEAIAREKTQLQNKGADPATAETEKGEIARRLDLLAQEEAAMQAANQARQEAARPMTAAVAALQEESSQLQKQLEARRGEMKKAIGDLDKTIATLGGELAKNSDKAKEADNRLRQNFKALGEKLATAQDVPGDIGKEMTAVLNARTEMEGVQALIGGLERQKDEGQVSAYKKMMAIIIGGAILLAALIIALVLLLSPKKPATPLAALPENKGAAVQNLEQLAQQMQKGLGGVKAESERIQGGKIVIASEGTLKSLLPTIGGWEARDPRYSQGAYGALEIASLRVDLDGPGGDSVRFEVTDSGTASALLAPLKLAFSLNMRIDDADAMQQVSSLNGIPMVERLDKHDGEATLGIIHKDRYLIELKTSSARGLELLREFAAKLDLSGLQP